MNAVRALALVSALVLGGAQAAGAAGGGEEGGHPLGWQALNLLLLLAVLVWFARRPVLQYFSERRSGIETELETAARLLSQAETRNAEFQRRLSALDSEVEGIRHTARDRAREEGERILADAERAAERIRADARDAVDQEVRRARSELRREAADLAVELAADLCRRNVSGEDRDRLIDEFIGRIEADRAPAGRDAS